MYEFNSLKQNTVYELKYYLFEKNACILYKHKYDILFFGVYFIFTYLYINIVSIYKIFLLLTYYA
jgi:hypothetical protein